MIVTGLDFALIIIISYISGIGSGIGVACKYKNEFMIRSRSQDNLSLSSSNNHHELTTQYARAVPDHVQALAPIQASAPQVTKITLG